MPTWLHKDIYPRNYAAVVETLAVALSRGELALLLGAGCSSGVGLPSWLELVNGCCEGHLATDPNSTIVGFLPSETPSAEDLFGRMESLRTKIGDDERYVKLVHEKLYQGRTSGLVRNPSEILRALGALVMGSKRGKVSEIITLNFDCVLERYLTLHGFVIQVVSDWPSLLIDADVRIYHPHGYLPFAEQDGKASGEIIFDSLSVDRRFGGNNVPWNDVFNNLLSSRVILAVGLSGKDYLLRSLITSAKDGVDKVQSRPLGFWLCTPSVDPDTRDRLSTRGFIPIDRDDPKENPGHVAQFIFDVCQKARQKSLYVGENIL